MKTRMLSLAVVTALALISCKNDVKTETESTSPEVMEDTQMSSEDMAMTEMSFGVRGNCSMCKKTIEKAAQSVEGVSMANWDVDRKKIDVKYDESKTSAMAIHNAIAASGYDTEKVGANEEAYKALPECCQYDHGMMMNQMGDHHEENDHVHDH